ncbi:MAG: hypothetical protein Q8R76_05095 [Candidatus Omnitrophota bacterium]|nr:hypothetical protein [Candidatus Omnitrophota bacterium]
MKTKRQLGICDSRLASSILGDFLILLEELQINSAIRQIEAPTDIAILGDNPGSDFLAMAKGFNGVGEIFVLASYRELEALMAESVYEYTPWPGLGPEGVSGYQYGYTLFIQDYFGKTGAIPSLALKPEYRTWACDWLREQAGSVNTIAVHLKNKIRPSGKPDWYNARLDEWETFFRTIRGRYDVKFILVGNERVPDGIRNLENIIVTHECGGTILKDLALIENTQAFMGVASGPCQMAMFGRRPYVIFKNPERHVDRMFEELGNRNQYVFAAPTQRFLRRFETSATLLEEFEAVYAGIETTVTQGN